MGKYTTVRIDYETMEKLEKIIEVLQSKNIGKISKAIAIKYVVDCLYEQLNSKSN